MYPEQQYNQNPYQPDIHQQQVQMPYPQQTFNPSSIGAQAEFEQLGKVFLYDEDLIDQIEHELRGEVWVEDDKGGRWEARRQPLVGDPVAISTIIQIIRFQGLNKVSRISNLTEDQIHMKLYTFECKLIDEFTLNHRAWKIQKSHVSMVYELIRGIVEDARFVSKDGSLLKTLRSTYSVTEYEDHTPNQRQSGGGGFLGMFKRPLA